MPKPRKRPSGRRFEQIGKKISGKKINLFEVTWGQYQTMREPKPSVAEREICVKPDSLVKLVDRRGVIKKKKKNN